MRPNVVLGGVSWRTKVTFQFLSSSFTQLVLPEVFEHPRPVAVLVHAGRVVAGLGPGDQGSEGDAAHSDGSHRPHRGPECGLWPRTGIEAGSSSPEGKRPVSAGGEAVVDPEETEIEASHRWRGREGACRAREASEAGRGYASHRAIASEAASRSAPASLGLSEV